MGEKIIGIDLGTTNSVVSVVVGDEPVVIQNQEGSRVTPSVVSWTKEKEILVGEPAKRRAILVPQNTVYESKRFIGRKYEEVKDIAKRVSYKVVADEKGDAAFDIPNAGKLVRPEEVGAHILRKLKEAAENYLGKWPKNPGRKAASRIKLDNAWGGAKIPLEAAVSVSVNDYESRSNLVFIALLGRLFCCLCSRASGVYSFPVEL